MYGRTHHHYFANKKQLIQSAKEVGMDIEENIDECAKQGILFGKTIVLKDTISLSGVKMMIGTSYLSEYTCDLDATVVTKLLDAGAIIVGKATSESLSHSGSSVTAYTGPVMNPYDNTKCSGGSSSGCAVLVALGECDYAIGADQGGSIRMPSSWSGIYGMKPTRGLISFFGCVGVDGTIDNIGPMTRTTYDNALLLEAMAGPDPDGLDHRQCNLPKSFDYTSNIKGGVKGLKIGILREGFRGNDRSG
jgi:amidase